MAVQTKLRGARRSWFKPLLAVAAVFLLAVLTWTRMPSGEVEEVLRIGLIDHVHCAIQNGSGKLTRSSDEMTLALLPDAQTLLTAAAAAAPAGYRVVEAHKCTANGRHYTHIIMRNDRNELVSFVVSARTSESMQDIEGMNLDGFDVAGFQAGSHLGFVVSNLGAVGNERLARALQPAVRQLS